MAKKKSIITFIFYNQIGYKIICFCFMTEQSIGLQMAIILFSCSFRNNRD